MPEAKIQDFFGGLSKDSKSTKIVIKAFEDKVGRSATTDEILAVTNEFAKKFPGADSGMNFGKFAANTASGIADLGKYTGTLGGNKQFMDISAYGDQLSKIFDAFNGKNGGIMSGIFQTLQFAEDQIFEYLQEERDVRNDINKSMSVTGKLGDDIRDTILQSSIYANRYGLQLKDRKSTV